MGEKKVIMSNDKSIIDTSWYTSTNNEFVISTPEQLMGLSQLIRRGNDFTDKVIHLGKSIKINDTTDFKNRWEHTAPDILWEPIGTHNTPFNGTFNGNKHSIEGVYCDGGYEGLFGYTGKQSIIKHLTLKDSYSKSHDKKTDKPIGALAAINHGTIYKCEIKNVIFPYHSEFVWCNSGIISQCSIPAEYAKVYQDDWKIDIDWYDVSKPYSYISSVEDFIGFMRLSGNGHSFINKTVKLTCDIMFYSYYGFTVYLEEEEPTDNIIPIGMYYNADTYYHMGHHLTFEQHLEFREYIDRNIRRQGYDRRVTIHECTTFEGCFDGCGHFLHGLYVSCFRIYDKSSHPIGLFRHIGKYGCIKNLTLSDILICSGKRSGAIAGINDWLIMNCSIDDGDVGVDHGSGMIAGENNGLIMNCNVRLALYFFAYEETSRAITYVNNGTIQNCCAIIWDETGTESPYINDTADITKTKGNENGIKLIHHNTENGKVINSYYGVFKVLNDYHPNEGIPVPFADICKQSTFQEWDFEKIWWMGECGQYPRYIPSAEDINTEYTPHIINEELSVYEVQSYLNPYDNDEKDAPTFSFHVQENQGVNYDK